MSYDFHNIRYQKALGLQRCQECRTTIPQDERYRVDVGKSEGSFYHHRICAECEKLESQLHVIRDDTRYEDEGLYSFGDLWSEAIDAGLLTQAEAKTRLEKLRAKRA